MFGLVLIINVGATGLVARSNAMSNKRPTNIQQTFDRRLKNVQTCIVRQLYYVLVWGGTILIGPGEQTARPYIFWGIDWAARLIVW